ncbi:MAG: GNAT family N-acetyltransferase [Candidatus Solibacter sp.]
MAAKLNLAAPAECLEWDSHFFQRRIARARAECLTDAEAVELLAWCQEQRIDCLYFLAKGDSATVRVAERHGFELVDIRVTYERELSVLPERPAGIRAVRATDVERLKQLTGRNLADSRFYADRHFDPRECDALYAVWIERSCQGYANGVLVAERNGEAAGYVTCNLAEGAGSIGLIAVDTAARGEGIGQRLVGAALHYFREQGMTRATVVTQARNIASQRLYQRSGFLLASTALWYHRWFVQEPMADPAR